MHSKKLILNTDDFGLSKAHNQAVLEGYKSGILTSASLLANGNAFKDAVYDIIPKCPDLGIAAHLNIMEGVSVTCCPLLTNKKGYFNRSYEYLIFNQHNKELLKQIEAEFKAQIEKIITNTQINRLDSHIHTHAIPEIFKITCKLAKEYKIQSIRTQFEKPYFIPNFKKHLTPHYPINLIKVCILNFFTQINKKTLKNYRLKTNDYIIGVGYTGMMDSSTVKHGLKSIKSGTVEVLIHPCVYKTKIKNSHTKEFEILKDFELKNEILKLGYSLTDRKNF